MVVEVMNVYVALDLLAKAVREAREERGLSQRELARKLSMNTRTIMDLEICRSNPKGETIFLIARELHISLDAIAHAGTSRPNSVSADVLEFFSGKDDAESKDYINLCRQVEMMKNKEDPYTAAADGCDRRIENAEMQGWQQRMGILVHGRRPHVPGPSCIYCKES